MFLNQFIIQLYPKVLSLNFFLWNNLFNFFMKSKIVLEENLQKGNRILLNDFTITLV